MKQTFKQFLEDINTDDYIFTHDAADKYYRDTHHDGYRHLRELPIKQKYPIAGYKMYWRKGESTLTADEFIAVLKDTKSAKDAVILNLVEKEIELDDGVITGVKTDLVTASKYHRGKNLVVPMYETLIKNGQNLFSAQEQSPGGRSIWNKLVRSTEGQVFLIAPARDFPEAKVDSYWVLVSGDVETLEDKAYTWHDNNAFWFIAPKGANMSKFKKHMVKL